MQFLEDFPRSCIYSFVIIQCASRLRVSYSWLAYGSCVHFLIFAHVSVVDQKLVFIKQVSRPADVGFGRRRESDPYGVVLD